MTKISKPMTNQEVRTYYKNSIVSIFFIYKYNYLIIVAEPLIYISFANLTIDSYISHDLEHCLYK